MWRESLESWKLHSLIAQLVLEMEVAFSSTTSPTMTNLMFHILGLKS